MCLKKRLSYRQKLDCVSKRHRLIAPNQPITSPSLIAHQTHIMMSIMNSQGFKEISRSRRVVYFPQDQPCLDVKSEEISVQI